MAVAYSEMHNKVLQRCCALARRERFCKALKAPTNSVPYYLYCLRLRALYHFILHFTISFIFQTAWLLNEKCARTDGTHTAQPAPAEIQSVLPQARFLSVQKQWGLICKRPSETLSDGLCSAEISRFKTCCLNWLIARGWLAPHPNVQRFCRCCRRGKYPPARCRGLADYFG